MSEQNLKYGRINMRKHEQLGVTLIEILLILVIIAAVMATLVSTVPQRTDEMRINKVTVQMQQILSAGLSFYLLAADWPRADFPDQTITGLQAAGLLPGLITKPSRKIIPIKNAWGNLYYASAGGSNIYDNPSVPQSKFYVYSDVATNANAQLIAGRLPGSFVTEKTRVDLTGSGPFPPTPCQPTGQSQCTYVVASVDVPGQNLSNATSISFGSIYHSGACVPQPSCPMDKYGKQLTPQIFVIPVGVFGANDGFFSSTSDMNAYPISSYTAKAYGPTDLTPSPHKMTSCDSPPSYCYYSSNTDIIFAGTYWRVCLYVTTKKGIVTPSINRGNILAITRCAASNENTGAAANIWQP